MIIAFIHRRSFSGGWGGGGGGGGGGRGGGEEFKRDSVLKIGQRN